MSSQPNILLITSDQHRSDSMGCAGHPAVRTPHLDQLAREGIRFTRATTECPVCIPARTGLLTGIHPAIYGMPSYADSHRFERPRNQLLGSLMTQAGYQTVLVGKRHWHRDPTCTGGFETVIPIERCKRQQSLASGGWGFPTGTGANELSPGQFPLPQELYSTNWITDRCCEVLLERDETRPLFLWASFVDPHPPLAIHEPYYSMYRGQDLPLPVKADWVDSEECPLPHLEHASVWGGRLGAAELQDAAGVYYGMITNLDHQLGRLFGMLQTMGILDDTLILYTSDHGEMMGDHGDAGKSSFYHSASDIPFILRPPKNWNVEPGQEQPALVGLTDLLPTLCQTAGITPPEDISGRDLTPLVREEAHQVREWFIGAIDGRYLVDNGEHRWLYHVADGSEQFFHSDDRHEEHPLPCDPEQTAPFREKLIRFLSEAGSPDIVEGTLRNEHRSPAPRHHLRAGNALGLPAAGRHLRFPGSV